MGIRVLNRGVRDRKGGVDVDDGSLTRRIVGAR